MRANRLREILNNFDADHMNEAVQVRSLITGEWIDLNLTTEKITAIHWFLQLTTADFEIEDLQETLDPEDSAIFEINGSKYEVRKVT